MTDSNDPKAVTLMRAVIAAKIAYWDAQWEVEKYFGRELNFDIHDVALCAASCDTADELSDQDITKVLDAVLRARLM